MNTVRGVLLKGVTDVSARLGSLVTFPVTVAYLHADGYGAYAQVNTIVGFVVPFAALGLGSSMVRFFSARNWTFAARADLMRVLTVVLLFSVAVAAAMVLAAPLLNDLFVKWGRGAEILTWGAGLVVAGALEQVLLSFLRSREWLTQYSLFQFLELWIGVAATVVLLQAGYGIVGLLQATVAIKTAAVAALLLGLWTTSRPTENGGGTEASSLRQMIRFGIPVTVAGLGLWAMNFVDRLVIGHFMAPAALGVYSAAYTLAFMLISVNSPLILPMYPRLMRAIASHKDDLIAREVRMLHRYSTIVLVPSGIFLVVITPQLLLLMGGETFRIDLLLSSMLVAAVFFDQWNGAAQYTLNCVDQVGFAQRAWMYMGVVNLLANLLAVPLFGLSGAAFATLVTFGILEAAIFWKASQFVPLPSLYRFDVAWKATLSCAVGAVAVTIWFSVAKLTVLGVLICAVTFGVSYLLCMLLLREITREDFQVLSSGLIGSRSPVR